MVATPGTAPKNTTFYLARFIVPALATNQVIGIETRVQVAPGADATTNDIGSRLVR